MKTLLTVFTLVIALHFSTENNVNDTYCDGWEDGFEDGYCYEQGMSCVAPATPVCPIPKVGQEKYQDGYNRAFKKGEAKRKKDKGE